MTVRAFQTAPSPDDWADDSLTNPDEISTVHWQVFKQDRDLLRAIAKKRGRHIPHLLAQLIRAEAKRIGIL